MVNQKNVVMILIKCLGLSTLLLWSTEVLSQQLHPVYTTAEIIDKLIEGSFDNHKAAVELAIVGEHTLARRIAGVKADCSLDSLSVWSEQVLAEISDHQIIVINEAHWDVNHRVFVRNLLPKLRQKGFKFIALECLTNHFSDPDAYLLDAELPVRGYPLYSLLTGTYSREPEMGKLIRNAIALDMDIIAYEEVGKGNREEAQARNICHKLSNQLKDGKLIVFCGYSHVFEYSATPKMVKYLKECTGVDVLTIDQINYTSTACENDNTIFYKRRNSSASDQQVDIKVYHAIHSESDLPCEKEVHVVSLIPDEILTSISFPTLVKVFNHNESEKATPLAIFELESCSSTKTYCLDGSVAGSYLKVGDYRIDF